MLLTPTVNFCRVYMQINLTRAAVSAQNCKLKWTKIVALLIDFFVRNIWSKNLTNDVFRQYVILISGIPHVNGYQIWYNGSKIMQTKWWNAYPWVFVRIPNIFWFAPMTYSQVTTVVTFCKVLHNNNYFKNFIYSVLWRMTSVMKSLSQNRIAGGSHLIRT